MAKSADHLIWIDMEMTGLDPETCVPIEIATIVTDSALNVLAEGPSIVIKQPDAALDLMDEWNQSHHGRSGLTAAVKASQISCEEAAAQTLAFIRQWTYPGRSPLCGNSVGQDRRFMRKYMPELEAHFHYRIIDISTIKELARRWFHLEPPRKSDGHRALDDIREAIAELAFYRERVFTKPSKR